MSATGTGKGTRYTGLGHGFVLPSFEGFFNFTKTTKYFVENDWARNRTWEPQFCILLYINVNKSPKSNYGHGVRFDMKVQDFIIKQMNTVPQCTCVFYPYWILIHPLLLLLFHVHTLLIGLRFFWFEFWTESFTGLRHRYHETPCIPILNIPLVEKAWDFPF